MKKQKIFAGILLLIGLILIFGMSIWLGFPSPHFDRTAITPVAYAVGAMFFVIGGVLAIGDFS